MPPEGWLVPGVTPAEPWLGFAEPVLLGAVVGTVVVMGVAELLSSCVIARTPRVSAAVTATVPARSALRCDRCFGSGISVVAIAGPGGGGGSGEP